MKKTCSTLLIKDQKTKILQLFMERPENVCLQCVEKVWIRKRCLQYKVRSRLFDGTKKIEINH